LQNKIDRMSFIHARAATFHSVGKENLYKSKGYHKVNNSKVYFIADSYCQHDKDLRAATNFITKLVGFAKEYAIGIKGIADINDSKAWMNIIQTQDISLDADVDFYTAIEVAMKVLQDSNRNIKEIDFSDMIYLPLYYNINFKQVDWLIVDEAQDTNISRKLMMAKLLKENGRLLAIGDPNQAIYGFTGAEGDSMNKIKEQFNAKELPLSVCYRCGQQIVDVAKQYQPHIEAFGESPQGEVLDISYDEFLKNIESYSLSGKDGIICRNNAPNVAFAFALIRRGIGCRIEGRDIGQSLLTLCNKWKRINDLTEFSDKLAKYFEKEFERANRAKLQILEDKLHTMIILIERCITLGKNDLNSLRYLIETMFTDSSDNKNPDIVTLSSIHKSKGLEFDRVFILGNDQFIPSKYAVTQEQKNQEQNLLYVSVTRAINTMVRVHDVPTRRDEEPVE
jgi:DNA helicase II / ATP-dependent DNA helicase PcrA